MEATHGYQGVLETHTTQTGSTQPEYEEINVNINSTPKLTPKPTGGFIISVPDSYKEIQTLRPLQIVKEWGHYYLNENKSALNLQLDEIFIKTREFENSFASNLASDNPVSLFYLKGKKGDFNKELELITKIISFQNLKSDWDGHGAIPTIVEVTANSIYILQQLKEYQDYITEIYLNPHGTISIEWENRDNEILGVEIGKDGLSFYVKYNEEPLITGALYKTDLTVKEILQHLKRLYQ